MKIATSVIGALALVQVATLARAQPQTGPGAPSGDVAITAKPEPLEAPAPPSAPSWGLRAIGPATALRLDSTFAGYHGGAVGGSMFCGSYKLSSAFALSARFGTYDNNPNAGGGATIVSNPSAMALYAVPLGDFRLAFTLGATAPLGSAGGNSPDAAATAANKYASLSRAGYDGTSFTPNDLWVTPFVGAGYVAHGLTVQVEAGFAEAFRVRGEEVDHDATRTAMDVGAHAGYFIVPWMSVDAETRYMRYLSTPASVVKDPSARENLSAGGGLRFHFKASPSSWWRPGISYTHGLVGLVATQGVDIVQLDVPVSF